jgi:hypothetical protein
MRLLEQNKSGKIRISTILAIVIFVVFIIALAWIVTNSETENERAAKETIVGDAETDISVEEAFVAEESEGYIADQAIGLESDDSIAVNYVATGWYGLLS